MPDKVCADCGPTRAWSPDARLILWQKGSPITLHLLEVASGRTWELLRYPRGSVYSAQFSPEGGWIAFGARPNPEDERVYVAPFRSDAIPQEEKQWIQVADRANKPRWSPDGRLLYFTSDRDGFSCVWAQRLDANKRPVGDPFPVMHLHNVLRSYARLGGLQFEISVARDKLVFSLEEVRGNIWMTELPR
jgi:dipeptidyl aminopeptidase/acylaminoacyl peptidase